MAQQANDLLSIARAYFAGATNLLDHALADSPQPRSERLLMMPIAHLVGHGIELTLKANLNALGVPLRDLGSHKKGHHIFRLWSNPINHELKALALDIAKDYWHKASKSRRWTMQTDWSQDPSELLASTLHELEHLHSAASGYALRYGTSDGKIRIPKVHLALETFKELSTLTLPFVKTRFHDY